LRMDGLFSTHPATENRIAELEALAAEMSVAQYNEPAKPESPTVQNVDEPSQESSSRPWGRNETPPKGPWS
jgi:heat shock protein HtpX